MPLQCRVCLALYVLIVFCMMSLAKSYSRLVFWDRRYNRAQSTKCNYLSILSPTLFHNLGGLLHYLMATWCSFSATTEREKSRADEDLLLITSLISVNNGNDQTQHWITCQILRVFTELGKSAFSSRAPASQSCLLQNSLKLTSDKVTPTLWIINVYPSPHVFILGFLHFFHFTILYNHCIWFSGFKGLMWVHLKFWFVELYFIFTFLFYK